MKGRILGVDPGDKRIGLSVSDEDGIIANPLIVISHINRATDAAKIAGIAEENRVVAIVIGQSLDDEGEPTPQGRKAGRLGDEIACRTRIPIVYWDESGSTKEAQKARCEMQVGKKKRMGHMDELAATVILQSYLNSI